MSFAVHLFVTEPFRQEPYDAFLNKARQLYGDWNLEEAVPFNDSTQNLTIHECWVQSKGEADPSRFFRVNIEASRHLKDVPVWPFEYKWHLRLETSAGRTPLGLGVQLGAWLLAMNHFRFSLAFDHDSYLKDEPTEFRSIEAVLEHIRRAIHEESKCSAELVQLGILDDRGRLKIPL